MKKTVEISGKQYIYNTDWDGQRLQGNLCSLDTETELIQNEYTTPQLALASCSNGKEHYLIHPSKIAAFIDLHKDFHFVFHNIAFDFWVIDKYLRDRSKTSTLSYWWEAAEGRFHDTMLLDMLYGLALNDAYPKPRDLAIVSKKYAEMDISKEDPYRIRYGEIIGKDWNTIDPGFLEYAIKDPIATYFAFVNLYKLCKTHARKAGVSKEMVEKYGVLTETIQIKGALFLAKVTANGIKVDLEHCRNSFSSFRKEINEIVQGFLDTPEYKPLFKVNKKTGELVYTKNNMPSISNLFLKELLLKIAKQIEEETGKKVKIPMTEKGNISCSMKEWEDQAQNSPFIEQYSRMQELTKLCQFFKLLQKERVYPRYTYFVRTGRVSGYSPNLTNVPKRSGMRENFEADDGYLLVAEDYKFIELRTLAHVFEVLYGKSVLADVIRQGIDPHCFTGAMFNEVPYDEFMSWKDTDEKKWKKWRQDSKICFHKDVECLTPQGWKKVSELNMNDKIAQYEIDGTVSFVHPLGWYKIENKPLVKVESRHFCLRVTPDHRMYCLNWDEKPIICEPHEMPRRARKTVHSGYLNNKYIEDDILAIRQAVAIQADGSLNQSGTQYSFGFKREDKIKRFEELFGRMFPKKYRSAKGVTYFYLGRQGPWEKYLNEKIFNVEELLKCSPKTMDIFLDELYHWDGTHKTSDRHFSYTSVIETNTDAIQAIAAIRGRRTVLNKYMPKLGNSEANTLSITTATTARPSTLTCNLYADTSDVYCVTVPSSLILTRDMGKVQVVGNCNFGLPGGLSAKSLVHYAKIVYKVDFTLEQAESYRNRLLYEVYPELGQYLSEDSMLILAENLGCSVERCWEAFDWKGDRHPAIPGVIRKIVGGIKTKKDGTPYNERFYEGVWEKLNDLNRNPVVAPLLRNRQTEDDILVKLLFWTSVRTTTGRIRGRVSFCQNKNCLDAKTEALTKRGWVKGFDLTKEDILLTKNAETGQLEWQQVIDLKFYPDYEGPLVEFRSNTFNAVSTPDHRWLVYNRRTRKNVCKTTSEIDRHGDLRIHLTGEYIAPKEKLYPDDFVRICGWFLTDGTANSRWTVDSHEHYVHIKIFQSQRANPQKVSIIEQALDNLNACNSKSIDERTELVTFNLKPDIAKRLYALFPERILTLDFILKLTKDQLAILINTMIDGDGCRSSGSDVFFCKSKESADIFQVLCTLLGYSSRAYLRDMSKYKPRSKKLLNIPNMSAYWIVRIKRRNMAQVLGSQQRTFISRQPIWCPIVPNTYFVARRENRVFITGNTPFQGLAADGAKLAGFQMIKKGIPVLGFVHDEFIFQLKDRGGWVSLTEIKEVLDIMCKEMHAVTGNVPIEGDFSVSKKWKKDSKIKIEGDRVYPIS